MELPPQKRDGCAAVIMQLMEISGGQMWGINGEQLKLADLRDFTLQGIPVISRSLFKENEGKALLDAFKDGNIQLGKISSDVILQVNDQCLLSQAEELKQTARRIYTLVDELRGAASRVPVYMKDGNGFCQRLNRSSKEVEGWQKKLRRAAELQERIAISYQKWDDKGF